jgi:peptide/nickel transport system ATP-binding protein
VTAIGDAVIAPESSSAAEPLLEVRDLAVRFPTPRGDLRAVDGVSFRLESGATLGIVGESGSGKSVLSRAVMNLLPTSARVARETQILFEGRDLRRISRADAKHLFGVDVAMVLQDPMTSLTPVLTIGRQIMEPLRYHQRLGKREARERGIELLQSVGIPEPEKRMGEYPHQLSGGMRQRVTIAIALSCEPKLLIADEPSTALDVTVQQQVLNMLERVQEDRQMGMILVTHDLGVVAGRTTETAVMYAGRIVERAATSVLFRETRHPYTEALFQSIPRLGDPTGTRLRAVGGRPPVVIDPPAACRFAPRCPLAQPRCLEEDPVLVQAADPAHEYACFFPVGTAEGAAARAANLRAGRTAAGLEVGAAD